MRILWRRAVAAAFLATVLVGIPGAALAAAPSNDTYQTAIPIASLPYTQAIDLTEATDDPVYPPCEAASHRRIWYTFTPPANEAVRVSVGGDTTAELAVWTVVHGGPKGIHLTKCAVDGNDLVAKLSAGTTYAISVGQWVVAPPLIATLTISVQPPPPNDDFANATAITSSPFQATIDQGTAAAATIEQGEPSPSCLDIALANTVWYRFSQPQAATLTVNFGYISTLAIYKGTSLGSLTELNCSEGSTSFGFDTDAGSTYYFQIVASPSRDTFLTVDFAVPPPNDNFVDAITIPHLPATLSADLRAATVESGEPTPSCAPGQTQTVWYTLTSPDKGTLSGTLDGTSAFWAAYSGSSLANLTELGCGTWYQLSAVKLDADQVVYIQLGSPFTQDESTTLNIQFQTAPPNDDFASAQTIALSDSVLADLNGATTEQGEPAPPTCGAAPGGSVWYRYTATGDSVSFQFTVGSGIALAAYAGSDVGSLTELGCRSSDSPLLTLRPAAGQTIYIQLWSYDYCCGKTTTLSVFTPANPVPTFATSIPDPSTLDDISFVDTTKDPGGNPITSWDWAFGDGYTSTDQYPVHRYAADGDYSVTLSVETSDGRVGSASQTVSVRTHDIGIAKFMVPTTAKSGQTKQITVGISNRRYPESVSVELLVSRAGGAWEQVGYITKSVPVLGSNQTVDFQFAYTFTPADASAGKVTFRAIAAINNARDVFPSDNEAISLATKVMR